MASPDEWFNGVLEAFQNGTLAKYVSFDLGLLPTFGIHKLARARIMMPQHIVRKAVDKHHIELKLLKNLPSALANPVCLFLSKEGPESTVIQLDTKSDGESLVVVVEYLKHSDFGMTYLVKSIHPRPKHHFKLWEDAGLLLYSRPVPVPV